LEQASWRRHHGGGIKEEASQRRHLGRRHQGGGIWEEASKEEASKNEMPINIFIKKYGKYFVYREQCRNRPRQEG
jgi:hypothetical protein